MHSRRGASDHIGWRSKTDAERRATLVGEVKPMRSVGPHWAACHFTIPIRCNHSRAGWFVDHEEHEKLVLLFLNCVIHLRFHLRNLLVGDSFVLLFVNLEYRFHDFVAFVCEQYFSMALSLVAGPARTLGKIFSCTSCTSCVSWLIHLAIL